MSVDEWLKIEVPAEPNTEISKFRRNEKTAPGLHQARLAGTNSNQEAW